jgi:hypothetical protein
VQNRSLRSLTILHNGRRFPPVGSSLAQLATIAQLTAIRHVGLMTLSSSRHDRIAAAHCPTYIFYLFGDFPLRFKNKEAKQNFSFLFLEGI